MWSNAPAADKSDAAQKQDTPCMQGSHMHLLARGFVAAKSLSLSLSHWRTFWRWCSGNQMSQCGLLIWIQKSSSGRLMISLAAFGAMSLALSVLSNGVPKSVHLF